MGSMKSGIFILSGILLVFYLTGLVPNTGSWLAMLLNPPGAWDTTQTGTLAFKVLAVVSLSAIIAVGFTSLFGVVTFNLDLLVMSSLCVFLLTMLQDFIAVFNKVYNANHVFALIIFSPLFVYYLLTVVEFWRGRD